MSDNYYSKGLFTGKQVVITGAGRGIGAAVAQAMVADGANVFAHLGRDTNKEKWIFPDTNETKCDTHCCDLSALEGIESLAAAIVEKCPHIDVLIHNAGTMLGRMPADSMSAEHYADVTNLNARSVVLLTTRLLPLLRAAKAASIVNVTSISAATGGSAGSSMYSASKGFISTYTRSLATELAVDGIRVNAISPGTIDTDFHQRYSSVEKLKATASNTPLKRLGSPADCVPACLFLSAPELSGFITGQIIGINGGTSYA